MKRKVKKRKRHRRLIGCIGRMGFLCWVVVPFVAGALLMLDGLGIFTFTPERLLVIGGCAALLLMPFCSEISFKSFSVKKDNADGGKQ